MKDLLLKFLKFGIVGFSGMIVDFAVLFVFKEWVGLPPLWANVISFSVAASSNYFFNRIWTFKSKENQVGVEYAKFFAVSLIGLGINTLTLWVMGLLLPDWNADGRFYLLKLVAIAVTTIWNFFGNLLFTFKGSSKEGDNQQ